MKEAGLSRDFRRLWAAHGVSLLGSQVTFVALPLVALLSLGASPAQLGLLSAAGTVPYLLFGLVAGAWVDRLRRRPILVAADLGRALLIGSVPLAAVLDLLTLAQLIVVAFAAGALTLCFDVAQDAYVPALLPRERLVVGNSRLAGTTAAAETAGPGLGALAIQVLTAPVALALDAGSFLVSALFLGGIRTSEPRVATRGRERGSFWREVRTGLRAIVETPILRALTLCGAILQLTGGIFDALQALFITRTLGLPPFVFGLLFTVGSLSGLLGALFATPLLRRMGPGPAILTTALLICAGWLTMPLAFGTPGAMIAILVGGAVVRGLGNTLYNIGATTVRQAFVPGEMLGRVNSAGLFLAWGLLPIGSLAGGFLGAAIGIRETLLAGSIVRIILLLACCAAPLIALRAMPAADLRPQDMTR